jgi:nitrate/nitrite transporter NarK
MIGMLVVSYSSDRRRERHWHVALCGFVAAACYILLHLAADSIGLTVACLTIASIAIYSILSLFWTIPSAYLQGSAAAGGIALISSIGALGGAVSPAFVGWMKVQTGSLYGGFVAVGVLHAAGMLIFLVGAPRGKLAGRGPLERFARAARRLGANAPIDPRVRPRPSR